MVAAVGVTISEKTVWAALVPSVTVRATRATPNWPGAGVRVTVRLLPPPPKEMLAGVFGSRIGLADTPETPSSPGADSKSPTTKVNGAVGVLTRVLVWGRTDMNGAVLPGSTVTLKLVLPNL